MGHAKGYGFFPAGTHDDGVTKAFPVPPGDKTVETMPPIVVSFGMDLYSQGCVYRAAAAQLVQDCRQVNYPCDVYDIEPPAFVKEGKMTVRRFATHLKPIFIKAMLEKHKRPIWWLDCDARVIAQPEAPDPEKYIMAVHYQPHRSAYPIRSAELWFSPCKAALDFLDEWERHLLPHLEDHTPLVRLWKARSFENDSRVLKTSTKGWCINNGTKIQR